MDFREFTHKVVEWKTYEEKEKADQERKLREMIRERWSTLVKFVQDQLPDGTVIRPRGSEDFEPKSTESFDVDFPDGVRIVCTTNWVDNKWLIASWASARVESRFSNIAYKMTISASPKRNLYEAYLESYAIQNEIPLRDAVQAIDLVSEQL